MIHQLPLEVRFLKRFARHLHEAGVPAHHFERMLTALADKLGLNCQALSSPTSIFLSFQFQDDEDDSRPIPNQLERVSPPGINLGNTAALYQMGNSLLDDQISTEQAYSSLKDWQPEQLYPLWLQIICWGLTGGTVAVMLSASWAGIAAAAMSGALLGILVTQAGEAMRQGGLEAIAALLSTFLVFAVNQLVPGLDVYVVIMSSLIVLIPGLGLTTAVTELSTDHLASGSARLAGALVTLLKLSLGVLIGTVVVGWFGWSSDIESLPTLATPPDWFRWPALLAAAFSFGVLFSARRKDFHIAMLAAILSYVISRIGVAAGGLEFGVLLASMSIAVLANLYGRVFKQTGALIRVPGVILLVPGTVGYHGATALFLDGGANLSDTVMLALRLLIALVGGLLFGNTLLPPRRGH
ncbi:MAG: threonine/serine exporter family protein [Xanthomonadales bacterium]|nr:threonine/serine exporter family protein [Gammaproteobacteria bacterium]NNK05594.1 threonine/serine exporter family protein [Xanthomonadales bacterium]NNL00006.1 threonine/serine exporter family protein [Xanthomonadales bacterium]